MTKEIFSEEDLATLSEEERNAITADDGDEEAQAETLAEAGDEDGEDDSAAESQAAEAASASDAAGTAADQDGQASEADPAGNDDAVADRTFLPQYQAQLPDDFDEQVKSVETQKAELLQQYRDGDIDPEELIEKQAELNDRAAELRELKIKSEIATEHNKQTAEQRWQFEQDMFFEQEKNKVYSEDIMLHAALNAKVVELGNKHPDRSGTWVLTEADRQVREKFSGVQRPAEKPNRKPDLAAVPKTLGGLPAAEQNETGTSEFAHLDKLTGMELENALAKLPEDQQQRYLQQ